MGLKFVTLTGADETVDPKDMMEISREFPFVEWGILIGSHTGHRFPSPKWIESLICYQWQSCLGMNLSLHICGDRLDAIINGKPDLQEWFGNLEYTSFSRIQLNFHGEKQADGVGRRIRDSIFALRAGTSWTPEIIFQLDGINDDLYQESMTCFPCSGLQDKSHGAGVVPEKWPSPHPYLSTGWAGGLGPRNVGEELKKINELVFPVFDYWIDMETNLYTVRRDGTKLSTIFDLDKCREVLKICQPMAMPR